MTLMSLLHDAPLSVTIVVSSIVCVSSVIMTVGRTAMLLSTPVPVALQRDTRRTVPMEANVAQTVV